MYAIMTTHGTIMTTRRKAILHAARAKNSYAITSPDPALTALINQIKENCTPRGAHPKTQTDSFHRFYLDVRLSCHKLDAGIKAIKANFQLTGQDAEYKITEDFKNCWIIRVLSRQPGNGFKVSHYLISRQKGEPVEARLLHPSTKRPYEN